MVEVQAARPAAARRTDTDIAMLRSALDRRRTAAAETGHAAFADADIALHAAVVEAVADGDGEAASRILRTELDGTPAQLLGR